MDFLREIVSGPKNRYQKNGYNLDLTYVTDRIIGMSFPAEGFEKLYRNSLDDIKSYQWEDHHSPPLHMLFDICQEIHKFLNENPENVVIVHCKAGKGRTGTIICCYFLYCNMFNNPQDALYYYGKKRFNQDGLGVNQPCQKRYVEDFFWQILQIKVNNLKKIYPKVKIIDSVTIFGRPKISDEVKPYVIVIDVHSQKQIMSTKKSYKEQKKFEQDQNSFQIKFDDVTLGEQNKGIHGDILIKIYDNCKWSKDNKMGRMAINSAFISSNNILSFNPEQISPSQFKDDKKFPSNYRIQIKFRDLCEDTVYTKFEDQCEGCKLVWSQDQESKKNWEHMYKILENYKQPSKEEAKPLLFKNQKNFDVQIKEMNEQISNEGNKSIGSLDNEISFYIQEDHFHNKNSNQQQSVETRPKSRTFVLKESPQEQNQQTKSETETENNSKHLVQSVQHNSQFSDLKENEQQQQDQDQGQDEALKQESSCQKYQKQTSLENDNNLLKVDFSPKNNQSENSESYKQIFQNTSEDIRKRSVRGIDPEVIRSHQQKYQQNQNNRNFSPEDDSSDDNINDPIQNKQNVVNILNLQEKIDEQEENQNSINSNSIQNNIQQDNNDVNKENDVKSEEQKQNFGANKNKSGEQLIYLQQKPNQQQY
ncbi:hypothetical protein PPERSA_10900 [Pseudocohnilembus persalinus]|uniref:Uncharacterized protein n=1 Tax=Pseudocohnilembus persalinus TaxID=266149 RepID=A0A0V0R9E3_PSEPJ|nr:hypothetical protein PPERSA_10900 [Pseudocohnilembus persalinus]|eukprot:KRX11133.1 hypothetical protein PPERSA_10900 [Pseudocohnilembus persalinus]